MSILIRIWHSGSKCWSIEALVNTCLNRVKARLWSRVKKLGSTALCTSFVKLDLANFLLFLLLLPMTLLLLTLVAGRPSASYGLTSNTEISRIAILLKPWMKRQ